MLILKSKVSLSRVVSKYFYLLILLSLLLLGYLIQESLNLV